MICGTDAYCIKFFAKDLSEVLNMVGNGPDHK